MQNLQQNIKIVLMETSHPGNIGSTARAMKNMGFSQLTLVNPKKFPDKEANALAAGADDVLANAQICETLEEALSDCFFVAMTTARQRESKWQFTQSRDAAHILEQKSHGQKVALVFGPERTGLSNQDLDKSHLLIHIPTSAFSSLNLAMAVNLMCYEIHMCALISQAHPDAPTTKSKENNQAEATKEAKVLASMVSEITDSDATQGDREQFYDHAYSFLEQIDFFRGKPTTKLMRKIRHIFQRSNLSKDEIHLLRGIFSRVAYQLSTKPLDSVPSSTKTVAPASEDNA